MQKIFKRKGKTCPRCFVRLNETASSCPSCGLSFAKFELATNKAGKRRLKNHEKEFVIMSNHWPSDVNYPRFLCLTIFLGLTGAHFFKAGRMLMGWYMLICFVLLIVLTALNELISQFKFLTSVMSLLIGVSGLMWLYSIVITAFKKFKFPVSIDDEQEVAQDIIDETLK